MFSFFLGGGWFVVSFFCFVLWLSLLLTITVVLYFGMIVMWNTFQPLCAVRGGVDPLHAAPGDDDCAHITFSYKYYLNKLST